MGERVLAPIASHLASWEIAHVELAIYGVEDARSIALTLEDLCTRELRCAPEQTLFYQSSISALAGLRLCDGREIVINAHQPDWTRERLAEVTRLQSIVSTELGLAPHILVGPAPLGNGYAVEEYVARGLIRNGHDSSIRRALAESLYNVVGCLTASGTDSRLPSSLLTSAPTNALRPPPHSKLFDFDATRDGAEYIDEVAAIARGRMVPVGRRIIGHSDL